MYKLKNTEVLIEKLNEILKYKKAITSFRLDIIDYNREVEIKLYAQVAVEGIVFWEDIVLKFTGGSPNNEREDEYIESPDYREKGYLESLDDNVYHRILSHLLFGRDVRYGFDPSYGEAVKKYTLEDIINFKL